MLSSGVVAGMPTSRHACALTSGVIVLCLASCEGRPLPPQDDGIEFGEGFGDGDGDADPGDGDADPGDGDATAGDSGAVECAVVVDELLIDDDTPRESVECVEVVLGDLRIGASTQLVDLELLSKLREVGGELYISGNAALTSLAGLRALERVDHLHIRRNHNLGDLHGLDALDVVDHLTISKNAGLTNLAGLPSRLSPSLVEIADNDLLPSLDGLPLFVPGPGDPIHLVVEGNASLVDLSGLSACCSNQSATLILDSNDALSDLDGLEGFTRFETLRLHDNLGLSSLDGLDNVAQIGALELSYDHCAPDSGASLLDLSEALSLVELDVLQIEWVDSLTSLAGLWAVPSLSKLLIRNNAALPWADVLALEAQTEPALLDICGGVGGPECPHDPCPMF